MLRYKNLLNLHYLLRYAREFVQRYVLKKEIEYEPYHIANITDPHALYMFLLEALDYQDNFMAYVDKGELYNIRRYVFTENDERWQAHIRIFPDEVRAHYEISYEENWLRHYNGSTVRELPDSLRDEIELAIEETQTG